MQLTVGSLVLHTRYRNPLYLSLLKLIVDHQDNTAKNCTSYGVLITQSYPSTLGTPGNGVIISVSSLVENRVGLIGCC